MLAVRYGLDTLTILTTLLASWLWYAAGRRAVRRISRHEVLDAADINRLVVTMKRSAFLNRRATLATATSAAFIALRFVASLILPA